MTSELKQLLAVGLLALSRMAKEHQATFSSEALPSYLQEVIDGGWNCVDENSQNATYKKKFAKRIERDAVDEQDATEAQMSRNYVLYALEELLELIAEPSKSSIEAITSWALDRKRFLFTQSIFSEDDGAIELTPEQIASVETSALVQNERDSQSKENEAVKAISPSELTKLSAMSSLDNKAH